MTPHLQRATLLIDQGRFELAEKELAAAMAQEPEDSLAHGCMALCLLARQAYDRAAEFAQRAIHLRPDAPWGYYVSAVVWRERNYLDKAEAFIREAVALDPQDPDYRAVLGGIKHQQGDWEAARLAAEDALALDAEHIAALNLRAESLRKLGRTLDAHRDLENALRVNPDSAETHAALGWTYLQDGQRRPAEKHFREALRLDPESEWARQGVLESLRAYNPVYRPLLKYFIWMQSLGRGAQWGVILGGYFGYRILGGMAEANPALAPWLMPLIVLYIVFAAATWLGQPLMNLALRLHPFGRLALSRDERIGSNWIGGFLAAGLTALGASYCWPEAASLFLVAIALLLMVIPLATMFNLSAPQPRRIALLYTLAVGACGVVFVAGAMLGPLWIGDEGNERTLLLLLGATSNGLLWGAVLAPLATNILCSITWKK
jgi:tetratricopeptide (TPR) repeat protein